MALGKPIRRAPALGAFNGSAKMAGFVPAVPRMRGGAGDTPALGGIFRRGPAVGVSRINTIATNITRGGGN